MPGEAVILASGIHWKRYIVPFAGLGANTTIAIIRIYFFGQPLVLALHKYLQANYAIISLAELSLCAMFLLWSISETIRNLSTTYCITDRRIVAKKGWLSIRVTEMRTSRCETISVSHPLLGRILGYGDILAVSAGASIFLEDVPNPYLFKAEILKCLENQQAL